MDKREPIKFRDGEETLTLWPEKSYPDGWAVGWCPERKNNIAVHPNNVLPAVNEQTTALTCRCVFCGHTEPFSPIPADIPMCPKCFSPMVAESARASVRPKETR